METTGPGRLPLALSISGRAAASGPNFSWTFHLEEETTEVALCGEIDLAVADGARSALLLAWKLRCRRVVVDLTSVTFIDSFGLRCLLKAFDQIVAAGGSASITSASPAVRRVLELSGLGAVLRRP